MTLFDELEIRSNTFQVMVDFLGAAESPAYMTASMKVRLAGAV